MNEYIPSTAEVRDAYSSESTDSKYANRSFDLWLAKYKAKTIAKAEERIIKLLTDSDNAQYFKWLRSPDVEFADYMDIAIGFRAAIALIEGDKN